MTVWRPRLRVPAAETDLRRVFGGFPSGVVAVCAVGPDGEPVGMAVSSFTSVSLSPAMVSVSVTSASRTWPGLRAAGTVGISVLAEGAGTLCRALAGPAMDRFTGADWAAAESGAVFLRGAVAWLECAVAGEVAAGDHAIVLLEVRAVGDRPGERPLVFHGSRFWALAESGGRLVDRVDGDLFDELVGLAPHAGVERVLTPPAWRVREAD
ncbi:Flavin-dependent monooxygenase, reductase subunit HsaB [Actinomadura rubteroloni]|uniref:Flavin-dependent monooxygenase, reductase subunit HsaB n=1 Tax=Actinomadura rubteroloni TaxID=1926885 RepID=A0A2P4UHL9_9ACTN|nr:flavin reductase family protein [Actinomadura rubteroloni]POM24537.1 Flavin-dependent monooxygenase, reductase subunit HsaB [Actinomadura rubteroloni]